MIRWIGAFKHISKGNAAIPGIPDGAIIDGGNTLWLADGNESRLLRTRVASWALP